MTPETWLNSRLSRTADEIELGLGRIRRVADRLALLGKLPCTVLVGGTNGKGSSVRMFECILAEANIASAAYTSPHLHRFNERLRIGLSPVDDDAFIAAFERVEDARQDEPLTWFEYTTLGALLIIADSAVDVALLEVGLGGRLDATNIANPAVSLVTGIGRDHEKFLGNSLEQIAIEKAHIARTGRPFISASPDVPRTLVEQAKRLGARVIQAGEDYLVTIARKRWTWQMGERKIEHLPALAMPGTHQIQNAAGVLASLYSLPKRYHPSAAAVRRGLQQAVLPGRVEIVHRQPFELVFDVSHNEQGIEALVRTLQKHRQRKTHLVLGMLADKDVAAVARLLSELNCDWYLSAAGVDRALSASELMRIVAEVDPQARITTFATLKAAFHAARLQVGADQRVLVTGSFHTVDEVRRCISLSPNEASDEA